MKRGSGFLTAIIAAALTFGSLMAFVGPQKSGWNRHRYKHSGCNYDSDNDNKEQVNTKQETPTK